MSGRGTHWAGTRTVAGGANDKGSALPTTMRPCLKCGDDFPSYGKQNRICPRCKNGADWKEGDPAARAVMRIKRGWI
jgi:hypothetical protein